MQLLMHEELGKRIRAQRERRGLRQQDVAHALQVSPQAVSKWERGENGPDLGTLAPLARVLGVSTDWLLGNYHSDLDTFEATVFVCDVQGVYEKSLGMKPRDYAAWVNGFLFQMTEAVLRHEGIPVKYIGDALLCFFSGAEHSRRGLETALLAKSMVRETLRIGLSRGEIYFGKVGHPDYARSDIMGDVVNIAFLTNNWAGREAGSMIAATAEVVEQGGQGFETGREEDVNFIGIRHPVRVVEIGISPAARPPHK